MLSKLLTLSSISAVWLAYLPGYGIPSVFMATVKSLSLFNLFRSEIFHALRIISHRVIIILSTADFKFLKINVTAGIIFSLILLNRN